jgi:hypothetical protein
VECGRDDAERAYLADGLAMEGIYVGVDVYAIRESPKIELEIFAALNQADAAMRRCRNQ